MALSLATSSDQLTRSATYLNRSASWTRLVWGQQSTLPTGGSFRIYHQDGDLTATDPYIYLGSPPDSLDLLVEVFDGANYLDTATFTPTASTWFWAAEIYDDVAHTVTLIVNGTTIGNVSVNLSTVTFPEKDQFVSGGATAAAVSVGYIREWQSALTVPQLTTEAASQFAVITSNLLTDTPLPDPTNVRDISGNGRNWAVVGTATFIVGPLSSTVPEGSLAFSGFGDSAMVFYSPSGVNLGVPSSAPWIGNSDGSGGCSGIIQMDNLSYGVTGAGYPFAVGDFNAAAIDSQLAALLGGDPNGEFFSIASNYADAFYGLKVTALHINPTPSTIELWKFSGTDGSKIDSFALPSQLSPTVGAIGVDPNETACYHVLRNADTVYKQTLGGSNASFATETGFKVADNGITVLRSGDVLIGWEKSGTNGFVKHYDSSGTLLHTYALTGTHPAPTVLTPGLTDSSFFVGFGDASASTFSGVTIAEIEVGTGTILNSFQPSYGNFEFDGPFCVVRVAIDDSALDILCPGASGQVSVPYSSFLVASGGTPPYTFAIDSGSLPIGLSLNPATGEVGGTPIIASAYAFTPSVTDADDTVATVDCGITISSAPPPPTPSNPDMATIQIRRMRRTPHINQLHKRIAYPSFELLAQVGEGLLSGQGINPQVMLRWSDDGGRTWSREHWTTLGRVGEYRTRVIWRQLGQARDRVFEVVISDPVNVALISAYLEANIGTN